MTKIGSGPHPGAPRPGTPGPGAPRPGTNAWLFFRRWLANPKQVGSVIPSSPALGRKLAREIVRGDDEVVVELGGGTGAITSTILERVPPEKLYVLEINPEMAQHLRRAYPGVTIIEGDARKLSEVLPRHILGRVGTTVCGIPMLLLSEEDQRAIVSSAYSVMPPGREIVLYTYKFGSPLPQPKLGLSGRRAAWVPANIPPASVWAYRRA